MDKCFGARERNLRSEVSLRRWERNPRNGSAAKRVATGLVETCVGPAR